MSPRSPQSAAAPLPRPAALLLGPSAAGKTPLGDIIERQGLWGMAWRHFDFGARLRAYAAGDVTGAPFEGGPDRHWIREVREILTTNALLRDDQFPIAEEVLRAFLAARDPAGTCWLLLNGLPRHAGQAEAIRPLADVRLVIRLDCDAATVAERIARDTGGDRRGRTDDGPAALAEKLNLFHRQTAPLLAHYATRGIPCSRLPVGPETTADELHAELARRNTPPALRRPGGSLHGPSSHDR